MNTDLNIGVGLNLRLENIDEVLRSQPKVSHFEIIADNWLSSGAHHKKLEKIRNNYPIYFHCVGMNLAGEDKLNNKYLRSIKELRERYNPLHISDHLAVQEIEGIYLHDLLPFPFNKRSLERVISRVNYVQEFLGEKLLIENLSYYVEYKNSTMNEAEFLNQLSEATGCRILLDINNIWVNELNLKHKAIDFLKEINLDSVKELHIASPELIDDVYVDTHGGVVSDEVLDLTKTIYSKITCPITYERDRNIPSLTELIAECSRVDKYLGKNND